MVVCGWLNSPLNLYSARCVKTTVTVSGAGKENCRKWISAPADPSRGRGRMKWGCLRAVCRMRVKELDGSMAQREVGEEACRRRQMYSISLGGSARILSRSRYEERVFRPGGAEALLVEDDEWFARCCDGTGAGGGEGKGDVGCSMVWGLVVAVVFRPFARSL